MKIFLEKYRLERGLSMLELSKKSGVAVSHIHNIEMGETNPTISILCKLSKVLKVPCAALFSCDD